jgi:hypothetical protein
MREDAWDIADCGLRIADCLPSVAVAKEGGFPPPLKHRRTGRIADLTAKNAARKAATEVIAPRISQGHFGGTPKWAGESPALPLTFSVFGFFVVKELFMRWRMSDFLTGDNGDNPDSESGIPNRDSLFSLFVPVESLPIQYGFGCPWNAVFWSFLRLFAENQHNLFAINNLQPKMSISN